MAICWRITPWFALVICAVIGCRTRPGGFGLFFRSESLGLSSRISLARSICVGTGGSGAYRVPGWGQYSQRPMPRPTHVPTSKMALIASTARSSCAAACGLQA